MLELKNISYSVESEGKKLDILKNINLKIEDRFVAITGPNGSGKSTLAKVIAGIIKPTQGQVIFDGKDITDMSVTDRAKAGISFAFQQPVKFKGITVRDLVTIAAGEKLTFNEVCAVLSEVGLCARDYVDREINSSLSGGELKRIEIATLLARGTKLSIFDEPEAGIDLWSFNSLIKVFEQISESIQGNIIIISHQERILEIADKIVLLTAGEITQIGTKDEIMPQIAGMSGFCPQLKE
jgi:Fe-S cluster assembly ATP-binding protein